MKIKPITTFCFLIMELELLKSTCQESLKDFTGLIPVVQERVEVQDWDWQ